nr:MAG TPA: hypothetical protein [Caudoviricetes sp.]
MVLIFAKKLQSTYSLDLLCLFILAPVLHTCIPSPLSNKLPHL